MAETARQWEEPWEWDISNVVTEDETPVDNMFSEKQQQLLVTSLYDSWHDQQFLALANVGLFYQRDTPPVVPDVMLSLDVTAPPELFEKQHRSYFTFVYGKPPDLVVEVVSNDDGHEERKIDTYAEIGVPYYVIYDPERHLSSRTLRGYVKNARKYVELADPLSLPDFPLRLALWTGIYSGFGPVPWLRWATRDGVLLPTGAEQADQERQRTNQERVRADQERVRADQERQRADRLAAKLRELGVEEN